MTQLAVVAVGGNALSADPAHPSIDDQITATRQTMQHIADMIAAGWKVVVTHGNGPQVGFLLRRVEIARGQMHDVPLDVCGADTQGAIGYMFTRELAGEMAERGITQHPVAIVTQTVVSGSDPAFASPSKPIGSFMSAEEAAQHAADDGWDVVEDAGRGWRRVVASPEPERIVEIDAVKALIDQGFLVVAAGGGGIPVMEDAEGHLTGVEAVIDKDRAAALLAREVEADLLLIPTAVDKVSINFNTPAQVDLDSLTALEARKYLEAGEFGAGSMGPKIEAALSYLEQGGSRVIITRPDRMTDALNGQAGTTIVP